MIYLKYFVRGVFKLVLMIVLFPVIVILFIVDITTFVGNITKEHDADLLDKFTNWIEGM